MKTIMSDIKKNIKKIAKNPNQYDPMKLKKSLNPFVSKNDRTKETEIIKYITIKIHDLKFGKNEFITLLSLYPI